MSSHLLSRLVQTILTLLVMSILVFAGLYLVGNPVDVAETLAYLCGPASGGVDGQVVRVCGQNLVGA